MAGIHSSKNIPGSNGEEAVISQQDVDIFKSSIESLARYRKLGALLVEPEIAF